MGRAVQSSVILQFARRVAAGSVVCRTVGAVVGTALDGGGAVIGHLRQLRVDAAKARAARTIADEERRVRAVLAQSRLVKAVDAAIDVPQRAWASSAARRWAEPIAAEVRAQPAAVQVRLAGWMLLTAGVTHIVLVLLFSEPVGWATWAAWSVFLALAAFVVVFAPAVAAAWAHRRPWVRRLLREPQPWQ